jgi:hypothetical protein
MGSLVHWSELYVGQPYVKDEMDCGGWAERIEREQFGRDIDLPRERAQGLRPRSRQIAAEKDTFAERTDRPVEGDGVLMVARGDLYHIGIYTVVNFEPSVVHAMEGSREVAGQVVRHRIRDLAAQGIKLEGYYKWI